MLRLVTAPLIEPITRDEAKEFLRVDHDNDDELITSLISAARFNLEDYISQALITQTWDLYLDSFPADRSMGVDSWWDGERQGSISQLFQYQASIELNRIPVQSITSFTVFTLTNAPIILDPRSYFLDSITQPNRVTLTPGYTWPISMGLRWTNAIQIRFLTGFGTTRIDVPNDIKYALKLIMAQMYDKRSEKFDLTSAKEILAGYRLGALHI